MCAIDRIYSIRYFVISREIEGEVDMDRCWVYKQIRELKEKKCVEVYRDGV